jgi:hypothetical protein
MQAAQTIRNAVARVGTLRLQAQALPGLSAATLAVKKFQARRFAATYADLLASSEYAAATRFFLDELYSDKDYSQRDAQFARIAGALQRFFPDTVIATAVSLAELHALTEEMDFAMAVAWSKNPPATPGENAAAYVQAWNTVGRTADRNRQLDVVLHVGAELDRLTRTPGLRMMLRMMRRPANAAGLGSLQRFLEAGFDTFAGMSGHGSRAKEFLSLIHVREAYWINQLFTDEAGPCIEALQDTMCRATPTAG